MEGSQNRDASIYCHLVSGSWASIFLAS